MGEELARIMRAHRVLSACNHSLVRAEDEDAFLADICRIIVDVGGYHMAWVGYTDQVDARAFNEQIVQPVAQRGYEDGYLEAAEIRWDRSDRGRGPTGTAIRTGSPSVVRNIHTDTDFLPWRDEAERRGYSSVIGLPLVHETSSLGALTIYAVEADAFDQEEVSLLQSLAEDLAYGIFVLRTRDEHKKTLKSLTHFQAKTRALLAAIPDTMVMLSPTGDCLDIQAAGDAAMWLPSKDLVGQNFCQSLPHDVGASYLHHIEKVVRSGSRQVFEYALTVSGALLEFEARLVLMSEQRILAIVRDITDRKTREAVIEEERERIARDLHDGLAQNLYFLGLKIDYLTKQVRKDPEGTFQELSALKKTVQTNIQDVRRTIFALRPVDLDTGFDRAIRTYVREFGEQTGITIHFEVIGPEDRLTRSLESIAFRLIQEGLNNIAKHARCQHARVKLSMEASHVLRLEISDDGIGFDESTVATKRGTQFGLSQMRQRVTAAGGTLRIHSVPAEGTSLLAEIPLATHDEATGAWE